MKIVRSSKLRKNPKWNEVRLPSAYFGFPVASGDDVESESDYKNRGKRGIALLIAIMVVAIVMGFMSDMIISSSVNVELALGNRDRVKSEYMAKSGLNLAIFLNSIDWGMDLYMNQSKKKPTDGIGDMWAAMNGLPIGGATMELMMGMQEKFDLSAVSDSGIMDQMKLFDGRFILNASDESSKINVNYCHKGRCTNVLKMLEALMSCPAEKAFLDSKELDPKELALRIKDFIDDNKSAESGSGFSDENDPYDDMTPRYQVKNAPFDSIEELKLVEGWDDEMHAVFSPYLTVFPFQRTGRDVAKININTASREMLACLLPEGLEEECREKFAVKMANQGEEKANFSDDGDIRKALKDLVCYHSEGAASDKEKKSSDKANWFVSASRVFRFEISGEVGNQTKKLIVVIERLDSKDMKKRKTKRAYDLLFWKLI